MNKKNAQMIAAILITLALFAIAIYTAIMMPTINLLHGTPPEKVIEFKGTRLSGWKDGQKMWEIFADNIWYTKNQSITTFENVKDGILYKKGRPVVKGLKAKQIIYDKWRDEIRAGASVAGGTYESTPLNAWVDVENVGSSEGKLLKPRFVFLSAKNLVYSAKTGNAEAFDNVRIIEDDLSINAGRLRINSKSNMAEISEMVSIKKKDTRVRSKIMLADFKKDRHSFFGDVEILQKEKTAVSDSATIENKTGEMTLSGNVKFLIEKTSAMLKEGSAKALKNPETRGSLAEKTLLYCDKLILSTRGKDAMAFGRVEITQKKKKARSDTATYNGSTEEISMTGNVFIEEENQWLKTRKVLISVSRESFEAVGQVEAEFKIKK